jgi:hypothetical protein
MKQLILVQVSDQGFFGGEMVLPFLFDPQGPSKFWGGDDFERLGTIRRSMVDSWEFLDFDDERTVERGLQALMLRICRKYQCEYLRWHEVERLERR